MGIDGFIGGIEYSKDYSESKYKKVASANVDTSGGVVIPSGQVIGITRVIANGADPQAYTMIVFAYGTGSEKIIAASKGEFLATLDPKLAMNQVTGDNVNKLQIVIVNDNLVETPVIGGSYEATII